MEAVIDLLQKSNYISVFTSEPHFSKLFVKSVNSGTKIGIVSSTKNSAQLIVDQCTSDGLGKNVENIGSLEDAFLYFTAHNTFNSDVLLINNCSYQRDIQLQLALLLKIWFIRFMEGELPRLIFIYRSDISGWQSVQNQYTIQIENQRDTFDTYFDKDFSAGVVMDKDLLIEKIHTINHDTKVRKVIIVPSSDYTTSEENEKMAQENIFFVTEDEAVNMNFSPALNPNLHTLLDHVEDLQRLKRYEGVELNSIQNGDGKIIFIDTCMRNLTYSSLGGGIRFIDGIVGANYLQLINSVLKAHPNSSLYRLIDVTSYNELEVVTKPCLTAYKNIIEYYRLPFSLTDHTELKVKFEPSLSYKPYVGKLATSLIQHSKDISNMSMEKQPIVSSVNGSVKKGKAKNKITDLKDGKNEAKSDIHSEIKDEAKSIEMHSFVLALAAMIDSLNHNFVEYPSFEDEKLSKPDFFVRHFMQYEGKDSLEIFAKLWNKIALKETADMDDFETFVIDNFLNYSMIMEFYNIYNTLRALHHVDTNEAISEGEINEMRQILHNLLNADKMTIVEDTLFSFICVAQDPNQGKNRDEGYSVEKYTIVKNLLFDDLKIGDTIYPLTREKDVIHTFIIHS